MSVFLFFSLFIKDKKTKEFFVVAYGGKYVLSEKKF